MQAVILAAGVGSRIRPLSDRMPKPMLPIGPRPIVAHTATAAIEAGADELVLVVNDDNGHVREHFGATYDGVPVTYAVQSEQQGTADALVAAGDHLDGQFALFNGDVFYDPESVATLLQTGPSIGTFRADTPSNYGVLGVDGETVTEIVEKPADPPSELANAGAYVLPEQTLEWMNVKESERGEYELTDVLDSVIDQYAVEPVKFEQSIDVGRPWNLLEANERYLSGISRDINGTVSPDATLNGPVRIEDGATVKANVVIDGPALVRDGATIGPGAYVRGSTVIGPGCSVGHGVEIKNSVLMAESSIGHLSYVGDSVLGQEVNFGAGTNVANLRHDDECVRVTVKGTRRSTGRRKFGVVVGHGAKTGINTSLNAGITLSSGSRTRPGEAVTTDR